MNVTGKTILLTGGAGGLGSEMAMLLAKNGAIVYLLDMDEAKGKSVEESIIAAKGKATFLKMDITRFEDWERIVAKILELEGHIDILVNNAGINIRKAIEEMSLEEWNTMMLVNVGSVFLGTKYVIPVMRNQHKGLILNTSSVCGLIGHRYTPEAYSATKGAVTILTKSIASRYAKDGIRCNSIHPSTVDTPLVQKMFADPVKKQQRLDEVPLGRLATSADVANAVLFLSCEESSFINGISLPVDGGVTCC
ncbi:SDR family oxidoreductase [uncultured Sphaerochaeta sp.]|uniref:SDR family NAD(P)-dependent oxidoreductase n=1 Tax=uncultured Sphaerochaeta sp. TaxID=886478 RepID=UPI002A0A669D|nr:SDR family oxidoreductase [uncultured Sphaerochaeta sp.]